MVASACLFRVPGVHVWCVCRSGETRVWQEALLQNRNTEIRKRAHACLPPVCEERMSNTEMLQRKSPGPVNGGITPHTGIRDRECPPTSAHHHQMSKANARPGGAGGEPQ